MSAPPEYTQEARFFSLSEVTGRIEKILQPAMGKLFWVKAEVSSGRERGGSFYCDLVETDEAGKIIAKMSCTIWKRNLTAIRKKFTEGGIEFALEDGTEVGLHCSLQYSAPYGLSLKVADADPAFALGVLELRRREILLRLEKEGLFEPNKVQPLAILPQRIALVTSQGSAAYNDFVQTLTKSDYGFSILAADAVMQGDQTEGSVLRAMEVMEKLKPDLIVIIRGGGSKTDLSFLDNEKIARRIAGCPIPVWTGIGHEIDTSVLDHVSHTNFKTPTAVAEEIVDRFVEMDRHLREAEGRFKSTWAYRLQIERDRVAKDKVGIHQGTRKLLDVTGTGLTKQKNELSAKVKERMSRERIALGVSGSRLQSTPSNLLKAHLQHLRGSEGAFIASAERYLSGTEKILNGYRSRFRKDRFQLVVNSERNNLSARKGTLHQGTRKLLDVTGTGLTKQKNELSAKVKERMSRERIALGVSGSRLQSTSSSLLKVHLQHRRGSEEAFIASAERYLSGTEKILYGYRSRFRKERFLVLVKSEQSSLSARQGILRAADPERSLERGFSLVYGKEGRLIKSIKDVSQGQSMTTHVGDGSIQSTVDGLEGKGNDEG